MRSLTPRLLFAGAGLICGLGSIAHARAYVRVATSAIDHASVAPFLAGELRALWLADSTTLAGLAVIFGYIAFRPRSASAEVMMLICVLPGATALLIYRFLGPFYAGHMLLLACAMAFGGAVSLLKSGSYR
jgi:hypothetical protein